MKNEPFVIEKTYNAPVERVWKAISNSEEMKQWYFDIPAFRPEPGLEFEFVAGPEEERHYRHLCKVTEAVPYHKLAYMWRYDGYEGNSLVSFELLAEGESTRLKLTHEGLETFPSKPDFSQESFAQGWTGLIGTALKEYVENPISPRS